MTEMRLLVITPTSHSLQRIIPTVRSISSRRTRINRSFIYLAHSMPHVPLAVSDKFKGKSEQGLYGDVMMELDWSVGEVLKALREQGLEENTLIVLTSDNRPWANYGNHAGSAGGLREAKATTFDGGNRIPCVMYWKGVTQPGTTCNKLASISTFFLHWPISAAHRCPSVRLTVSASCL